MDLSIGRWKNRYLCSISTIKKSFWLLLLSLTVLGHASLPLFAGSANYVSDAQEGSVHEIKDPSWSFTLQPPTGWKYQKNNNTVLLGHDTIGGMILVFPHMAINIASVRQQMNQGMQVKGISLILSEPLSPLGPNALAAKFSGTFQGQPAVARGIGTISPSGGGAYILAVTAPDKIDKQLFYAADMISKNMKYLKPDNKGIKRHFTGNWYSYRKNGTAYSTFAADGSFSYRSDWAMSGDFSDAWSGEKTGNWGASNSDKKQGNWEVRGTREQGVIILSYRNGKQDTLQYQVHVSKGTTYWSEYYIDGFLWAKE